MKLNAILSDSALETESQEVAYLSPFHAQCVDGGHPLAVREAREIESRLERGTGVLRYRS